MNHRYDIIAQAILLWKLIHAMICKYQAKHKDWILLAMKIYHGTRYTISRIFLRSLVWNFQRKFNRKLRLLLILQIHVKYIGHVIRDLIAEPIYTDIRKGLMNHRSSGLNKNLNIYQRNSI